MSAEIKKEIALEIAHVLFIDIVGYSKLSINDQHATVEELNRIVRASEQFQRAEAASRLIRIPTGDGMVLVFYTNLEAPAQCAVEISGALKEHPRLQLRMGIHSGPVSGVVDVNERANLAGAGINLAKRVMDCGDAGHILVSRHVAEDLGEYEQWRPLLHDLGSCEVKHGMQVAIVNLWSDDVGNRQLPQKFQALRKQRARVRWAEVAAALLLLAGIAAAFVLVSKKSARSTSIVPKKSIAVLPFENLSEEKANAFFTEGVQDEIFTYLAKIADLKVISRTSVLQYKSGVARNLREIAQQLGVANMVEGSVQRSGNRIRVNAQLSMPQRRASVGQATIAIWPMSCHPKRDRQGIADQLQAKLSPNEKKAIEQPPTTDLAAFDLYSRAKSLLLTANFSATVDPDLRKAIELLDEAVKREPSFFDAYCQLARAHESLYAVTESDHTPARLALAEAALQATTRLRPDAAETHLARAEYLYYGLRDYAGALAELEIARRALPNDPRLFELTGYILRRRGQQEEGLQNLQRAAELDPRNVYTLQQIAGSYQFLGRYAEAIAALDRALAIVPDDVETRITS